MANQYWNKKVVLITGGSSGIGLAAAKATGFGGRACLAGGTPSQTCWNQL